MVAAMKRRSSSAGGAAKRNRTRKLIPSVVDAIADSDAVAADLRILLKQSLPIVLEANKEDRHGYEAEVVNQAAQALKTVQAEREQAHQAALAKQNEVIAPAEEQRRSKAKGDAEAHLEAVKTKLQNNKATEKDCEMAVKAAEDALKKAKHDADVALRDAQKEEKAADKDLQHLISKKTSLVEVLENDFAALKDGTAPDAKASTKAVNKVLAVGKEYHFDGTLLHTLPITAKKQMAHRTEFEGMMFTSFKQSFDSEINALSQKIAAAEPAKAAKAQGVASAEAAKVAAIQAAQQALENAKGELKAAEEAVAATQTERHDASSALSKATSHLKHIWEDMRHVCDAQDEAAEHLKDLKEEVLAAFEELKEKKPEPEPVEEPEPMQEEAAAPEAAATEGA